ncbi:hypothetical protein JXJ21_05130 [candidate division KSB1 bacterium]|nr:hypothetical protein [candidate division KSB1 bacterium]
MNLEFASNFETYTVILEPDENLPEWWAGAPSVLRAADGMFYLAARMREGRSRRGLRGYEIRILKSRDGIHFEKIHAIHRDDAGVPVFERPALVQDPLTGAFRLYGCCDSENGWQIIKFDDEYSPEHIAANSVKPVIAAHNATDEFVQVRGYKDPFVAYLEGQWHLWAIGYDQVERTYHFVSPNGENWLPDDARPWFDNSGWHNFYTRPACVLPLSLGYLFVYEGSNLFWRDPVYNIATGFAWTFDLSNPVDLTPDAAVLKSTTPGEYSTWRYSHWLHVDDKIYVYAEVARPNRTNEIRLTILNSNIPVNLK